MRTIVRAIAVLCVLMPSTAPVGWEAGAKQAVPNVGTTERVSVSSDESQ